MESTEELQQNEITALKSIYAEDFIEKPPPKAWKGAARLIEFIINVTHPNPEYAKKIYFHLHITFPKTYPTRQSPIYHIQEPIVGLSKNDLSRLAVVQQQVVKASRGSETVMELVTACQEWLEDNVKPPAEVPGSLAFQMNQRAEDEEKASLARRLKAEEEALRAKEKEAQLAEELRIAEDAQKQILANERKTRRRAPSDATTVVVGDTLTETFGEEMEMNGVHFNTVKYYHPRNNCLGVSYAADPICDDVSASLPLELHVITVDAPYYSTNQGKKKLKQVESEIRRVTSIRHENVVRVLAVKLNTSKSGNSSQLFILCEQAPAITLQDLLADCDCLREDRVTDYLGQILSGLNAIHASELVHRGLTARVIGLASRDFPANSKRVKLFKVAFYTRLLDLHRSNAFRSDMTLNHDDPPIPDGWLSEDVVNESALLYTRSRDIHDVGIIFLQMLLGLDIVQRYSDVHAALASSSISPSLQRHALSMLQPNKRSHVDCLTLLADLSSTAIHPPSRSPVISMTPGPKTPTAMNIGNSPEIEYFRPAMAARHTSRWKEDWEELELLGKGAFGSVVKAKNKIDGRIYAVKKIRLRTMKGDARIFREVNALSRLSHRFIVRYYTTWVETSAQLIDGNLDDDTDSDSDSGFDDDDEATTDGRTSVPSSREVTTSLDDGMLFNLDDLDEPSASRGSFPSIHFDGSADARREEEGTDSGSDSDIDQRQLANIAPCTFRWQEFVERQTLKERIDEGLTENEAWRLFQQIVDALVHMSTLGILHRDIKLTNIFIDGNGDCKVGDFGLATSSLAAVDPSDVSRRAVIPNGEMTLDVGTRLYIAPEVQTRKRGPANHSKADMYSLGIVFFEMNFFFSTGAERIFVLESLRRPEIMFPPSWNPNLNSDIVVITWLLQHEPDDRPTALELSQSPLLPPRLEDEYFKGALRMMTKPDSPYHQAVLTSLFSQTPRTARTMLYDSQVPEIIPIFHLVQERLEHVFRLRGAVDTEPPLLLPVTADTTNDNQATFIDRHGDVVALSDNLVVPFARLSARLSKERIKRYHIGDVHRALTAAGHPKTRKMAIFDIITPDLSTGPVASAAEMLAVASDLLDNFPGVGQNHVIHISHTSIIAHAFARVPEDKRSAIFDILQNHKSSAAQRRADLLKRQLPRSLVDELEALYDADEDIDLVMLRLERVNPNLALKMQSALDEIKDTIKYAAHLGVSRPIIFRPLMVESHRQGFYQDGVLIEIVRRTKWADILGLGGRYDHLISRYSTPKLKSEPAIYAFGIQLSVDKIVWGLSSYQGSKKSPLSEKQPFGFWTPRRCDVYVVSYHEGCLQERMKTVSLLWRNGISADLMYESGVPKVDEIHDQCLREGILFSVFPRPQPRRDQTAYKVKSILTGAEYDVSSPDLVSWLQHEIAEQKRIDLTTAEAPLFSHRLGDSTSGASHLVNNQVDVQSILSHDTKKQRKQVRQILMERAYEMITQLRTAFLRQPGGSGAGTVNGIPVLALDISSSLFELLTRNANWVTEEDSFKALQSEFPNPGYATQVRDAVVQKKQEGHSWIMFFAVREERVWVLKL
uniref:non-specific serine/threonine protein kinase n=1 Tax=Moniliophthora roreri TaxID=221103 RepID=A0A0W0FQ29_MONRR